MLSRRAGFSASADGLSCHRSPKVILLKVVWHCAQSTKPIRRRGRVAIETFSFTQCCLKFTVVDNSDSRDNFYISKYVDILCSMLHRPECSHIKFRVVFETN